MSETRRQPVKVLFEREQMQNSLRRTHRIVQLLRTCNQALVRATDEAELLDRICRQIVEVGGYRLAWVGFAEQDEAKTVRPVAQAGFDDGYLQVARITWADTERGRGPVGLAIRTKQPGVAQNVQTDPKFIPWRADAIRRGYAACIALPLLDGDRAFGALAIYAAAPDAFDPEETDLLTELAGDLAYGILALRTRVQHQQAEAALRLSANRLQALLQLSEMTGAALHEITDFAMEEGVRLTGSTVGFLAFASEDESVLTLHSWSRSVMAQCAMENKPIVFPVESTGMLSESVRRRQPVIINDYTSPAPGQKDYPAGHIPITRFLNVPVFDGARIVAVAAVANKAEPYDSSDVVQLRLLMDGMWRLIQRKQWIDSIQKLNEELEQRVQQRTAELAEAVCSERRALESLKSAQSQLVQSEKLAALGQLIAGVAHEINNPLSFVHNNVAVAQRDLKALCQLLDRYRAAEERLKGEHPDAFAPVRELADQIDLPYLLDNLDGLLNRSRDGLRRIERIVKDLREFARLDEGERHEADLNAGIESTVNIVRGRARKKQVEIELDLRPLPPVACHAAKINQVVMNLLVNAIDACAQGGRVTVSSRACEGEVQIEVADNGMGIEPAIRDRIFDPFFTTKPPGEGTGLGLSISYGIVQEHSGSIDAQSTPGQGARFTVRLPIHPIKSS